MTNYWQELGLKDLEGEKWLPIKGFGNYFVSNFGRVKSLPRKTERIYKERKNNFIITKERIIKISNSQTGGYCAVKLFNGGSQYNAKVHRLVADAFIDNPLNKPQVNHINGIKTDNYVTNLEWVT